MQTSNVKLNSRILASKLFVCLLFALGSAQAQEAAPWQVQINWNPPTENVDGSPLTSAVAALSIGIEELGTRAVGGIW